MLFNNGEMAYFAWLPEISDDVWFKTINEELNLVFLLTRAAWPELIKRKGAIVNVASLSAWAGIELLPGLNNLNAVTDYISRDNDLRPIVQRTSFDYWMIIPQPMGCPVATMVVVVLVASP